MKQSIRRSTSVAIFLAMFSITAALAQGLPPENQADMTIDAKVKAETIDALKKALRDSYVYPDMGDKLAAMLEERQAKDEYKSIASAKDFAQTLERQMHEVAHDKHLRVRYSAEVLTEKGPPPGMDPLRIRRQLQRTNFAFEDARLLDGNIGYLKLNAFVDPREGGPTVAAAMAFLSNTDAMIIDLREGLGGHPAMVGLLASYFFDRPVELNDIAYRIPGTKDYETDQSWTLPYVSGERYLNKEVYVLTSHTTFSGAEEFTYDMQTQKRAIIVGQTTGGGANPQGPVRLGDHFMASMPHGYPINPLTHTNWEGKGVEPDINVPAKDALQTAYRSALENLIARETDSRQLEALKDALSKVGGQSGGQKQ